MMRLVRRPRARRASAKGGGRVLWAAALWAGLVAGCGGATPLPGETATGPVPEARDELAPRSGPMSEIEALEYDLAVSERRLDEELVQVGAPGSTLLAPGPRAGGDISPGASAEPPFATPPLEGPAPSPTATSAARAPQGPNLVPDAACDLACRSLASIRRAADGICRLTANAHERCLRAQSRARAAADRVEAAGCQCL